MAVNRTWSSAWAIGLLLTAAVLRSSAESPIELNQEGVEAFGAGDIDSAVFYFEQALKLDAENETIRTNLSNAYDAQAARAFEEGRPEYAIDLLEQAMKASPTNVGPLIRLGYIFLQLEENNNAIFRLEDAIQLAPESPEAHYLLGEAYYRDNDVVSALEQWEWVHEVKPGLPGLEERLETARREADVEGDYEYRSSRRFSVTHNPDLRSSDVRRIIRILDQAYSDVGRELGGTYPPGPIQVTLYAADEFNDSTQLGEHIGAVFDGTRIRCPVLTPEGELVEESLLRQVLYHEYVHVVIKHLAPRGMPWWLNEGMAEALSHELSGNEVQLLKYAVSSTTLRSMADLEASQLESLAPPELAVAYAQSHLAVEYLIDQYGMMNVVSVLKRIGSGERPDDALRKACRTSYETLDLAVLERIERL